MDLARGGRSGNFAVISVLGLVLEAALWLAFTRAFVVNCFYADNSIFAG